MVNTQIGLFNALDLSVTPTLLANLEKMQVQLKILLQQASQYDLPEPRVLEVILNFLNQGYAAALELIEDESEQKAFQASMEDFFDSIKQADISQAELLALLKDFDQQLTEFLQVQRTMYSDASKSIETLAELVPLDLGSSAEAKFEQKLDHFLEKLKNNDHLTHLLAAENQQQKLYAEMQTLQAQLRNLYTQEQVFETKLKTFAPVNVLARGAEKVHGALDGLSEDTAIPASSIEKLTKITVDPIAKAEKIEALSSGTEIAATNNDSIVTKPTEIAISTTAKLHPEKLLNAESLETSSYESLAAELNKLRIELNKAHNQLTTLKSNYQDSVSKLAASRAELRSEFNQELGGIIPVDLTASSRKKLTGILNLLDIAHIEGPEFIADGFNNTSLVVYKHYQRAENDFVLRPGQTRKIRREDWENPFGHG